MYWRTSNSTRFVISADSVRIAPQNNRLASLQRFVSSITGVQENHSPHNADNRRLSQFSSDPMEHRGPSLRPSTRPCCSCLRGFMDQSIHRGGQYPGRGAIVMSSHRQVQVTTMPVNTAVRLPNQLQVRFFAQNFAEGQSDYVCGFTFPYLLKSSNADRYSGHAQYRTDVSQKGIDS